MTGPVVSGVSEGYDVLDGGGFALFAGFSVADSVSQQISLTITLSDPGFGALFDPNAATDGGSYNSVTGVYAVSGDLAQVSAAVDGLRFAVAANPSSAYATLAFLATDGVGDQGGADAVLSPIAGTTYSGGGQVVSVSSASALPVGIILSDTAGIPDFVDYSEPGGLSYVVVALDSAQATLAVPSIVYLAGDHAQDSALFASPGWSAVYGDGGSYTLAGASLSVVGDGADVTFLAGSAGDEVSFWGSAAGTDTESVSGSDGVVDVTNATVTLLGEDDTVYFAGTDDTLDIVAATPGAWNTLYANHGTVDLANASLSIFGGGVTVDAVSGDDAVSLYQTGGADVVNGDDVTVALVGAEGLVTGSGDRVWFVGGANSRLTVQGASGLVAYTYGPGTVDLASPDATVVANGGGALVDFLGVGGAAYLSYTFGVWDRVEGASGATTLRDAQAVIGGGDQRVYSTGGDTDDQLTFEQTNGSWDSFYGEADYATISDAQVNVFGEISTLVLSGADAQASFYAFDDYAYDDYLGDNVYATNATLDVNGGYLVNVIGGGDRIYLAPGEYSLNTLSDTNGDWDTVYGKNFEVTLQSAQASVIGGGASIYAIDDSAVSLYQTAGDDDMITSYGGGITLNGVGVTLTGNRTYVYFDAGSNALDVGSVDDILSFVGAFGVDTVRGFDATDTLQLSKSQFADFAAFQHAFTQHDDDAVLTLDADDKVTFVGLHTSAVTASQVKFV